MPARLRIIFLTTLLVSSLASDSLPAATPVEIIDTPGKGIQPRALVDSQGVLHIISYTGNPKGGNLYHLTRRADGAWTTPMSGPTQVNSKPDSAIAIGTIRGAQAALGRDGNLHVLWNGFDASAPQGASVPMYYARSTDGGRQFEAQRPVSGDWPLDGGGAVAADSQGHVHVFWHAGPKGGGESARRIFIRTSTDDGKTFGPERALSPEGLGVCACCAMQALCTRDGHLHILYRTASKNGTTRDIACLASSDLGKTFTHTVIDPWPVNACPMSSMSLTELPGGSVAGAWEREGQVYLASFKPGASQPTGPFIPVPGKAGQRKHPALASTPDGHVLLLWAEGTGWNKGGTLEWQMFDGKLQPTPERGSAGKVPVWGLGSVVAFGGGLAVVR